jgi:hypothetical protein
MSSTSLEARITRYDRSRISVVQSLIPIATLAGIVARRTDFAFWSLGIAVMLLGATAWQLQRAVRRFGWRSLQIERGRLQCDALALRLPASEIREWTLHGGCARLYGATHSYKLACRPSARATFEAALRNLLGAPVALTRRGTPRARLLAALAAVLGAVALVAGILLQIPLLAGGVVVLILGFAAFMALSQRVRAVNPVSAPTGERSM